ncbi:hypothetical protein ES702_02331 [subsurface metagenome]
MVGSGGMSRVSWQQVKGLRQLLSDELEHRWRRWDEGIAGTCLIVVEVR